MANINELEQQLKQVNRDLKANKQLLIDSINNTPLELLNLDLILQVIDDLLRHKKELLYYINNAKLNNAVLE